MKKSILSTIMISLVLATMTILIMPTYATASMIESNPIQDTSSIKPVSNDGYWALPTKIGPNTNSVGFAINADINIDPDTLNMKSRGKWITAYIEINNKTSHANVNLSCFYWNQTMGYGYGIITDMQEGESEDIGCGTVKLLQTNIDQADFEVDYQWKETFTLSEGGNKKIWWGVVIIDSIPYNVTTTVGLNGVFEQYGGNVMDIDVDTVELEYNGKIVKAENNRKYGFVKNPKPHDSDNDGIPEFMVKFDRREVIEIVEPGMITLKVSGMAGNSYFEGFDTIRVIGRLISKFPKFILW